MTKHASELTLEELAVAGKAAGERAIADAHEAELAVTGAAMNEHGELWLVKVLPNGGYEWLEPIFDSETPADQSATHGFVAKNIAG
jgi:hypothetical protein